MSCTILQPQYVGFQEEQWLDDQLLKRKKQSPFFFHCETSAPKLEVYRLESTRLSTSVLFLAHNTEMCGRPARGQLPTVALKEAYLRKASVELVKHSSVVSSFLIIQNYCTKTRLVRSMVLVALSNNKDQSSATLAPLQFPPTYMLTLIEQRSFE